MFKKTISLGITLVLFISLAGCTNKNNYVSGESPLFFEEQYIFLNVGETAELNIKEIFKHSAINISDYLLNSNAAWIASTDNNTITALCAGDKTNGTIGYAKIGVTLYERKTKTSYRTTIAHVYVIDELAMTDINTVEDLIAINEDLNGHYILKNDLDLPGIAWQPLGEFRGMFVNVGNYKISNLTTSAGLFSKNSGFISGLILKNALANQINDDNYTVVGSIAASNSGMGAAIANCKVEGNVHSSKIAGGIVGYNFGHVINCTFSGEVRNISNIDTETMLTSESLYDVAGGIVGINEGIVANSTASGQVSSSLIAGGVVGINFSAQKAKVLDSNFIFIQELQNRLIAPIWGTPIGWERTLVNRN